VPALLTILINTVLGLAIAVRPSSLVRGWLEHKGGPTGVKF
jgi:hypothetical protein